MSGAKLPYITGNDKCCGCKDYFDRGEIFTFINGRNFYHEDCAEDYEQEKRESEFHGGIDV